MISKLTVDRIIDAARVEEVVGDYVVLKRRGANLLGNCPFHSEKTPSFTVSPVKGIYKCFGCGKAGNTVNFLMEHDKLSYPEALRALAKRYNIEIEETEQSQEQKQAENERESLLLITDFSGKYYEDLLWNSEEGKAIGLSYFKERGFSYETIRKFNLGYSLDQWSGLIDTAITKGYQSELLEKAGMALGNEGKLHDRFRGRVMFPIHSAAGKILGFGARILKTDPKSPKYINSPETPIYNKSQVLYGLYVSKKGISEKDNCILVEGYTDVISLHQAGIENVVASSGTSLTVEQARAIKRYTSNVTILYDGDNAGIKASLRGIDILLQEGLNIKIVLLPDGHDPDSFSRTLNSEGLENHLKSAAKDFILFKTELLLQGSAGDPVKKAALIKDIVHSISLVPDTFLRQTYTRSCSTILDVDEQVLINELNKARKSFLQKHVEQVPEQVDKQEGTEPEQQLDEEIQNILSTGTCYHQERDLLRFVVVYGTKEIHIHTPESTEEEPDLIPINVTDFVLRELQHDDAITIENPVFKKIFDLAQEGADRGEIPALDAFIHHEDREISSLAIDFSSSPYELSKNWEEMHQILVSSEEDQLKYAVISALTAFKLIKVKQMMQNILSEIKNGTADEGKMQVYMTLLNLKNTLSKELGRVIS